MHGISKGAEAGRKSEPSIVSEALLKIKTKDVEAWTKAEIGKTCLSKRRLALGRWIGKGWNFYSKCRWILT